MMKNEKKTTMSVEKAGEKLGICYAVALKAAKSGELPSIRIGKRFLVLREPLLKMLEGKRPA